MKMEKLAIEYRQTAAEIKARTEHLKDVLKIEKLCETEKFRLRRRIDILCSMQRDMTEAACVMEHYYDRRYKRNARYSI